MVMSRSAFASLLKRGRTRDVARSRIDIVDEARLECAAGRSIRFFDNPTIVSLIVALQRRIGARISCSNPIRRWQRRAAHRIPG
jgi:hypothetical protein